MNLLRRVTENTLFIAGSRVLGKACSFLVVLIMARVLGVEGFGKFAFVTAYLALFGVLCDPGLDLIVIREASRDLKGSQRLVGNAILMKSAIAVVVYGAALCTALLLGYEPDKRLYVAIAGAGFLLAPLTLYSSAFFSALALRAPALLELASKVLSLALVGLVVLAGGGLALMIAAIVSAGAAEAAGKVMLARRRFRPQLRPEPTLWKYLLKEVWPMALTLIPLLLIQRIDQVMLEAIKGDAVLGHYSAAVRVCEVFLVIPLALWSSLFPLLSRLYVEDRPLFERVCRLGFKYLSLAGCLIFFLLFLLSDPLVRILFGAAFAPSAAAMRVLAGSMALVFGGFLQGSLFVITGRQKALISIVSAAAVLNIVLNRLWIPVYGATGAGLATVASYGLAVVGMSWYPVMRTYGKNALGHLLRPGLAGGLALVVSLWCCQGRDAIATVIFVPIFAAGLLGLRTFDRDDRALLRRFLASLRVDRTQ